MLLEIIPSLPCYSSIEVPGTITGGGQQALHALGGEATLSRALGTRGLENASNALPKASGGTGVFLRCNPEDRFSKFFTSVITHRSDVLVKTRRSKKSGKLLSVTPVGFVLERVTFEAMADYYCAPPETSRSIKLSMDSELCEDTSEPLYLPPPVFTRIVTPFNYKFEDNAFATTANYFTRVKKNAMDSKQSDAPSSKSTAKNCTQPSKSLATEENSRLSLFRDTNLEQRGGIGRKKEDSFNAVAKYTDLQVPLVPPPAALASSADSELLDLYRKAFEMRPIWLRAALEQHVHNNATQWKKKPALARTCYLASDGPWRGALIRLGFDPRQDAQSRKFQTIDFRDPYFRSVYWRTSPAVFSEPSLPSSTSIQRPSLLAPLRNNQRLTLEEDWGSVTSAELRFKTPPSRPSQLLQLCDIDDSGVQRLIETAPILPQCSKESGWFPKQIMTTIRDLMLMSAKMMREKDANLKEGVKDIQISSNNEVERLEQP